MQGGLADADRGVGPDGIETDVLRDEAAEPETDVTEEPADEPVAETDVEAAADKVAESIETEAEADTDK